jgi:hypothetical protein
MRCFFCLLPILTGQTVNHHHVTYKSWGGTQTAPAHQHCHVNHHSTVSEQLADTREALRDAEAA